ncbi:hypothetical protein PSTEL_04405 [Paenibacillus stellifer]|uniref:DNA 3'-5' helicase n=1 Tax=Paenibacillus stellifer TaxID=169760 RepID=A0A089LNN1_9BACL|nr:UvrD-helicase domain-containing protein [Paenibacillus stellifer]AIQ62462.1 hypothetical protein PSTEL_04405 [Paenibacillus stellifer]
MINDRLARERIVRDLDINFLVEAGAGSGKTTSLVGRMIAYIETGAAEIQQIAAITFTRKAADELHGRFRLELEKRLPAAQPPVSGRLSNALRDVDQCFIGTIHSFCGRLLRERPIEAGVDPLFREIEEEEAKVFRDQCWDEYLMALAENGEDRSIADMEALGLTVEDLREVYHKVSLYTDVKIETQPSPRPDFDLIRLSLPRLMEQAALYIPSARPEAGWDSLQQMIKDGSRLVRMHGLEDDMQMLRLAQLFDKSIKVTQNRWTDKAAAKESATTFTDWQKTVLKPFLASWREYLYPQLISFVLPAAEFCADRRREAGLLDFEDLLMRSTEMLRKYPEVGRSFSRRYTKLLVDEFQDTDPVQAELMFQLCGEPDAAGDWRKIRPKPGSLFVVGDPKQSIYRFRRADISLYNQVKAMLTNCGEVLQLTANFRSVHAIGEFVNDTFIRTFPGKETEHQSSFVAMDTVTLNPTLTNHEEKATFGVRTLTLPKMAGGKAAISKTDAEQVAAYLAWACSGNLQIQDKDETGELLMREAVPGDFLILLKKREFISLYAQKLESYGIPAITSGSSAMYGEIAALAMLAQCLNDPDDRIALLAVLRGPLFGLSDQSLYAFTQEGRRLGFRGLGEREEMPAGHLLQVYATLAKLSEFDRKVRELPALAALLSIMEEMGLIPLAAVRENGLSRSGTLLNVVQLLQRNPVQAGSWADLTVALNRMAEKEALEGGNLFAGQLDAVRIMNLHKAKGLEAHVVFLACPVGECSHEASEYIDRSGETVKGYFSISRQKGYQTELLAHPPGWAELSGKERLFMEAEKERLLYVAATRAKQLLVISRYPDKPAADPWSGLVDSLPDAAELPAVSAVKAVPAIYEDEHDRTADEEESQAMRSRLARPTYRVASVTELAKQKGEHPPRPLEGRGMAFGSTVHRCIELLGRGQSLEELEDEIKWIAGEEQIEERLIPEVKAMLREVERHELWNRSRRAQRCLHELPIRTRSENLLIKGVVDFLFEEEDGWVVVDFKTDVYEQQQRQAFVDFYRPQVEAYRNELERAFGMKVKESGLYFLHGNEYVTL